MSLFYMFHKPAGCVTARVDDRNPTVTDYLPPHLAAILHPIGRLDKDTEGLLIFTNDGRADARLSGPQAHVGKTYRFYAFGTLTEEGLRALREGVYLRRGDFTTAPAEAALLEMRTVADCADRLPPAYRRTLRRNPDGAVSVGQLRIREGKWHQVKRMLRAVGCEIFYLQRLAVGQLRLDETLPKGGLRPLTEAEVALLFTADGP